jgi:RNA polymerase sigma-70 factor, ECF subfamily
LDESSNSRFNRIVHECLDVAWRTARRAGVRPEAVDDVIQEAFLVVGRRLRDIAPQSERAFVAATTLRAAANWQRGTRRRREDLVESVEGVLSSSAAAGPPLPEEVALQREGLALLGVALDAMTEPQREVFVLSELEQLCAREVSELLQLPEAAVVSRLRRAREVFRKFCVEQQELAASSVADSSGGALFHV